MDHWEDNKRETLKGARHRLDNLEMETCRQHHVSNGGLPVSTFSNGRRRPHIANLARERKYSLLLAVGAILGICGWVEFRLGKRSTYILPSAARVPVDQSFVQELQSAYDKYHEPVCASKSRKSKSTHRCGSGGDGTILSFQCQDGARRPAGNVIHQSLSSYNPTLVCAHDAVLSPSLSLQTTLEQKYDLVLVEGHSSNRSSKGEDFHDNLDFWKTMLLPRGIVARFCCSELVEDESPLEDIKPLPPASMNLIPWSSPEHQDEFLSHVATMYKSKVCSPLNKEGQFCRGNILSLDCNHGPTFQLLQDYMPGRGTVYCPQKTQLSSSSIDSTTRKFQNQVPLEELFHRRYEAIVLDPSNNYPSNLELWSQLLVPGGLIIICGTSTKNPIPSNDYLQALNLQAYYKSATAPYFLIFANSQRLMVNVDTTNKARQDETSVLKNYQPNQGKVDTQIQLSPVSFEDRYPTIYRNVANELLTSSSTCTQGIKKKKTKNSSCGPIKVLSFGCSYGFEMKSLADKYLTGKAEIYGVDVNDPVVAKAQENVKVVDSNKMVVLDGKTDPASNYGPFDAVFANSVLCFNRFPEPKDPVAKIKEMFTFETFVGLLHDIDGLVKVGGFLSLDNTNYLFNQTSLFRDKYQTYRDQQDPLCRQDVWLLDKNGTVIFNPHTDNRTAFTVYCIFVKVKE